MDTHFGLPGKAGYEESWKKNKVHVDFFSVLEKRDYFVDSLWVDNNLFPYVVNRSSVTTFKWGATTIRAPIPLESVLISKYGIHWEKPFEGKWAWNIHPFTIGSCTKDTEKKAQLLSI